MFGRDGSQFRVIFKHIGKFYTRLPSVVCVDGQSLVRATNALSSDEGHQIVEVRLDSRLRGNDSHTDMIPL